ncbi:MAG: hypothetical protein IT432_09170 [Phycisphaerales bacterium]|nr:hypothetical protein [Phycisphaerales bacterium]
MLSIMGSCVRRALAQTILSVLPAIPLMATLFAPAPRALAQGCQSGWLPGDGVPGTDGQVYASVMWDPDGDGPLGKRLVIAGEFSLVESTPALCAAMWDPQTGEWAAFESPIGKINYDRILTLEVMPDGSLIAGGQIYRFGDVFTSNGVMRWSGSAWEQVGAPNGPQNVLDLGVLPNGDLVAAGQFSRGGGRVANGVARWDGTQWTEIGGGVEREYASALAIMPNGDLVIGGNFDHIGGVPANNIARWDGAAWHPLAEGIRGSYADQIINSLTILPDGRLLVCGDIDGAGAIDCHAIACWDGTIWSTLGSSGWGGEAQAAIILNDGRLAVCGWFYDTRFDSLAIWNGQTWKFAQPNSHDRFLCVTELPTGELLLGGGFPQVLGQPASGIVRWSEQTGWTAFGRGLAGAIETISVLPDGSAFAGGSFAATSPTGGIRNLAVRHADTWATFGGIPDYAVAGSHIDNSGRPIIWGSFQHIGTTPIEIVARWNGQAWTAVGDDRPPGPAALTTLGNGTIVVGTWDHGYQNILRPKVQAQSGGAWSRVGHAFVGVRDGGVSAMARHSDGTTLAAIHESLADGSHRSYVARWDGSTWSRLGGEFNSSIRAMCALPDGKVVVGGWFYSYDGRDMDSISLWDGHDWTPLGQGLQQSVYAIAARPNGDIIAGGDFWYAGGAPAKSVALWDGTSWRPLGQGITGMFNAEVRTLAIDHQGDLLVGGRFSFAGGQVSANFARYRFCDCAADFNHDGLVNADDFDAFSDAFEPADPAADTNHDGFINADDYDLFAEHFDQGG